MKKNESMIGYVIQIEKKNQKYVQDQHIHTVKM